MYLLKLTRWNSIQEEIATQAKIILSLKISMVHRFQVQSVLLSERIPFVQWPKMHSA